MNETREEILEHFMRLLSLFHRHHAQNFMNHGPWSNPQRGQGRVLSILKMKPEISQKELTFLLDMSKQALAELLSKLEKSGYITREPSVEDRRSYIIKLTKEGATVTDEMEDNPSDLIKIFDCLNDEELATFNGYLKRIMERLEEEFPGNDDDLRKQMMEQFMHRHGQRGNGFHGGFGGRYHHEWGGLNRQDTDKWW